MSPVGEINISVLKPRTGKTLFHFPSILSQFRRRLHCSIMLPSHSPQAQSPKKPAQRTPNCCRNFTNSVRTHLASHPRFWLFIAFLWIQGAVIYIVRTPSPCFPDRTAGTPSTAFTVSSFPLQSPLPDFINPSPISTSAAPQPEECPSGKIYAYELPYLFNRDLVVTNCTELDRWNLECGIISNHGYGRSATELRRFLPDDLFKSWYHTNQFAIELLFHHRVLKHRCRTTEPESATAFYIPFYAGLAVGKHLWSTNDTAKRDLLCESMLREITKQGFWKKSNGSDHFITIGRISWDFRRLSDPGQTWGSSFLNMPAMQKVQRFIIEKAQEDELDISVPYPTGFHPKTIGNLEEWQDFLRRNNRSRLFSFVGATGKLAAGDFRGLLFDYCRKESTTCDAVDCDSTQCVPDSSVVLKSYLGSEFCLQPKGDSFTRRAIFDCITSGSVPVFFWRRTYEQYEWFLSGDPESYSVFIDNEEVRNRTVSIKEVLQKFSKEEIKKKREKVIETIPRITYSKPNGGYRNFNDAFDIALDGVMEKIKEEKEWADFLR